MLDRSSRTGGKYDVKKGVDKVEPDGSVYQLTTVKGRLLNPKETTQCPDEALKTDDFIILRPTNYMVTDDGDGILGNDLLADNTFALPAATASRLQYPAMEIDRTVNITTYGTAVQGDNLTYSVKITKVDHEAYSCPRSGLSCAVV